MKFMTVTLLFLIDYVVSRCGLDILKSKRILVNSIGEKQDRYLSKQTFEPLRIELDYSLIENNLEKINKDDLIYLKEKIMPKTKKVFEELLKVQRIEGKLRFNAKKCDDFYIPEKYLADGEGVDADLVIFISIDDTGYFKENGIEAAAIHCLQHSVTKRPVAGFITFKPDLNAIDEVSVNYQVWLAIHEISHVLAINDSLYSDFIDKNLQPIGIDKIITSRNMSYRSKDKKDYNFRINQDKMRKSEKDKERLVGIDETVNVATSKISNIKYYMPSRKTSSSQTITYIKSPKVLEKAKSHFNCDSLIGVPLEFNGGAGTNGAHWSKRFMGSDYMIGDSYGENLISEITLALFEDSGWYKVDYTLANLFLFGKNKGCEFLEEDCVSPIKSSNKNFKSREDEIKFKTGISSKFSEFCTDTSAPVCSQHNIFRGVCAIRKYDYELPLYEQHFNDPSIGGVDRLSERCPIPIEAKRNQNFYGGSCREGKKAYKFEKIGGNSSCFITNIKIDTSASFLQVDDKDISEEVLDTFDKSDVYSKNGKVAACFEFICKSNSLYVLIDEKEYKCTNGKVKNIEGYTGEIECPDKEVLCHDKYKCKFGCTE